MQSSQQATGSGDRAARSVDGHAEPALGGTIEERELGERVVGASAWGVGSMLGMQGLRFLSNVALAWYIDESKFGVIAILRIILIGMEQISDVGVRNSVIYHKEALENRFLDTAWTVQVLRGVVLWLLCCALAQPAALYYEEMPELAWLLPIAGLESINNGLQSVGIYTRQRGMNIRVPMLLEWLALVVSLSVTITWAMLDPSVWALVAGPLCGGFVKMIASHAVFWSHRPRFTWDVRYARDLFRFAKWVFIGTVIVWVAQQFHYLYLAKRVSVEVLGRYSVAWALVNQGTRVLTVISNVVLTPLFAQFRRVSVEVFAVRTRTTIERYLAVCLLVCVLVGMACPFVFLKFYPKRFEDSAEMGLWLAVTVWFMVLQQAPRSALLSIGVSRSVAFMSGWNAAITVGGVLLGYFLGSTRGEVFGFPLGAVRGVIIGNALGNVAGCVIGAWHVRRFGPRIGGAMLAYSCAFLAFWALGSASMDWLENSDFHVPEWQASLVVTLAFGAPLLWWAWIRCFREFVHERSMARAG